MKKKHLVGGILLAIGAAGTMAIAADLENLEGQSCGGLTGTWHFVNNQTDGAGPGLLNASFTGGTFTGVLPSKVNRNTQHFFVTSTGTLLSASTDLPGRLVLSDFTCEKKPPPPPK